MWWVRSVFDVFKIHFQTQWISLAVMNQKKHSYHLSRKKRKKKKRRWRYLVVWGFISYTDLGHTCKQLWYCPSIGINHCFFCISSDSLYSGSVVGRRIIKSLVTSVGTGCHSNNLSNCWGTEEGRHTSRNHIYHTQLMTALWHHPPHQPPPRPPSNNPASPPSTPPHSLSLCRLQSTSLGGFVCPHCLF